MKKLFRILALSITAILIFCVIAVGITSWLVFTPERVTPIAKKQLNSLLSCEVDFETIDPVLFSSFPNLELRIKNLKIINPTNGAPNDTLVFCQSLSTTIDVMSVLNDRPILIQGLSVEKGTINIFVDSLGNTNYDIFVADTSATESVASSEMLPEINLQDIKCTAVNFSYIDQTLPLKTSVNKLHAEMEGQLKSNILSCKINAQNGILSLNYDNEPYLINDTLALDANFSYYLDYLRMDIDSAAGNINTIPIVAKGLFKEDSISKDLIIDLNYRLENASVEKLMTMIPPAYISYTEGISGRGKTTILGSIIGEIGQDKMPIFENTADLKACEFSYDGLPILLSNTNGQVKIVTDAINDSLTYVDLINISANTQQSSFSVNGRIDQLFSAINCNIAANINLELEEFNTMIPAEYKSKIAGNAKGNIKTEFNLTQLEEEQYDRIIAQGSIDLKNFTASYDTLWMETPQTSIDFNLPNPSSSLSSFINLGIYTDQLNAGANKNYLAKLENSFIKLETSNPLDTTKIPNINGNISAYKLNGSMDTITASINNLFTNFEIKPSLRIQSDPHLILDLRTQEGKMEMGGDQVSFESLNFAADLENDSQQEDILLQWKTNGSLQLENGIIASAMIGVLIEIPSIDMNITPDSLNIRESNLIIRNSDFHLNGVLSNIYEYIQGNSLLKGDFKFVSDETDISELMALTSGIGYEDAQVQSDSLKLEEGFTGPYMVPKNMDLKLSTDIKAAKYSLTTARDITGDVTVLDGILTLDNLKLTTPATRLQLTAIYRTPRKNHIYMGLDYHMLDIEIEEILNTIPDIDSIMPMLKSFRGSGEFHMAIETYLDSLYQPKMSTLLGAASITGNDLVLMDGETFTEIAKTLKFSKKAENKVDSLSAEFTIFRNEIDVYPFLIVMDKYKAVVAGKHNLDMSFNYHISLVDSPLPIKLGVDVKGTIDDMKYRLAPCKYAPGHRPATRFAVQNKQLQLRNIIKNALVEKVDE